MHKNPKDRLAHRKTNPCTLTENPAGFRLSFVKHNPVQISRSSLRLGFAKTIYCVQ